MKYKELSLEKMQLLYEKAGMEKLNYYKQHPNEEIIELSKSYVSEEQRKEQLKEMKLQLEREKQQLEIEKQKNELDVLRNELGL